MTELSQNGDVKRLRPAHDEAALRRIYATPHDHTRWSDHRARVRCTVELAASAAHVDRIGPVIDSIADLSCGDAWLTQLVAQRLGPTGRPRRLILGDYAPGYDVVGPVEQTLRTLIPVDLYVCCETLEHLDSPTVVLDQIRAKTRFLLLSTPLDAWDDDNPEHYWAWSRAGVERLLGATNFEPRAFASLDVRAAVPGAYVYGVWWCR